MSVTSIDKDIESLSIRLVADFDAPVERVWDLWADPRKLERWWGPPTYPAKFDEHELAPGGEMAYSMTGPEGDIHRGWWRVIAVDPQSSIEFTDGFADEHGMQNDDMPTMSVRIEFSERDGATRMEMRSTFESREQMDQIVEMGAVEGFREAVGQMDGLLVG
jgi:uncharacterized protein YndB with AHSA1/START domain